MDNQKKEKRGIKVDKSDYPNLRFDMYSITNDVEYNIITNEWRKLYNRNKEFMLTYETKELHDVSWKYVFKLPFFMREIGRLPRLLKHSHIYVYDYRILKMLKFIFMVQKPLATVYVIFNSRDEMNNKYKKTYIFKP